MIPKYKQIPKYLYVLYIIATINIFFFSFSVIYFDLYTFYRNIGIETNIISVIVIFIFLSIYWLSSAIPKSTKPSILNIKKIRILVFILFIIAIAVTFCIILPYFEIRFNLTSKILNMLTTKLTPIAIKSIESVSKLISGFITLLVSTIIVVFQGVLGNIAYEYLIKPYIRKRKPD